MNSTSSNRSFIEPFRESFRKQPFYVLSLPLFFIMHGIRENLGFIRAGDAASLFILYGISAVALCFLLYLFYRHKTRAGLVSFLIISFCLFFGAVQDFLKNHFPFLSRYSILLPVFLVIIILVMVFLKRFKGRLTRVSLFLNLLMTAFIIFDLTIILNYSFFPPRDKFSVYAFGENDFKRCGDCTKPDIYFLLFDEYASTVSLKDNLGYDNSELDSFLLQKKFSIQRKSSGNYNFTPFAMASILNMSYINGIDRTKIGIDDYARCNKLIRENAFTRLLSLYDYEILNYSIFDLAGNPATVYQDFLPLKTKLISDRTLWGRLQKDLLWNLFTGKFEIKWFSNNLVYFYLNNNNKVLKLVEEESARKKNRPRFVYAHYTMPHPPFYFDENGKMRDKETIKTDYSNKSYLNNVKYTNTRIRELVNMILANTNGNAVIIIMGDHGYRLDPSLPRTAFFENQNAVYLPRKNYELFYDSMSAVNEFRVLANTLFKQNLPLLKDSTSFLIDKK